MSNMEFSKGLESSIPKASPTQGYAQSQLDPGQSYMLKHAIVDNDKIRWESIRKWLVHPGIVAGVVFVIVFITLVIVKPPMVRDGQKIKYMTIFIISSILSLICFGLSVYFK